MKKVICDSILYSKGQLFLYNTESFASEPGKNSVNTFNSNIKALAYLYEKGILGSISEYMLDCTENDEDGIKEVYFVLDVDKLKPYQEELKEQFPDNTIYKEEVTSCIYSGCVAVTRPMIAYRDTDGSIGESWEIGTVQLLSGKVVSQIAAIRDARGLAQAGISSITAALFGRFVASLEGTRIVF